MPLGTSWRAPRTSAVSSRPTLLQNPFDSDKPEKMLRWAWSPDNLADKSGTNPRDDSRAHRGSLNGDDLLIGYSWTPNWGRRANDKYDFYIRRSFNGGQAWTTDPDDPEPSSTTSSSGSRLIDDETQTVIWDEEVVTTDYEPGDAEPPRNVSNLRNNRTSVLEPRLVKTPGTINTRRGPPLPGRRSGYERLPAGLRPGVQPELRCRMASSTLSCRWTSTTAGPRTRDSATKA